MALQDEDNNVYYDVLAWRADAVANLARASVELKGPIHAVARAEIVLMMRALRLSINPKPTPAAALDSHASKVYKFLSEKGPHAKPENVGP